MTTGNSDRFRTCKGLCKNQIDPKQKQINKNAEVGRRVLFCREGRRDLLSLDFQILRSQTQESNLVTLVRYVRSYHPLHWLAYVEIRPWLAVVCFKPECYRLSSLVAALSLRHCVCVAWTSLSLHETTFSYNFVRNHCTAPLFWTWEWQHRLKWPSNVIQGHRTWYQSKARVWVAINFRHITHLFLVTGVSWNPHFCLPYLYLTLNLKVMPLDCGDEIWRQKTKIIAIR